MKLIRYTTLVCLISISFGLAGCSGAASSQEEGRRAILENTGSPFGSLE